METKTRATFTPRPWHSVSPDSPETMMDGEHNLDMPTIYGDGAMIAEVHSRDSDAALIAAAPDLYEALEALAMACDSEGDPHHLQNTSEARAALSKARGENP